MVLAGWCFLSPEVYFLPEEVLPGTFPAVESWPQIFISTFFPQIRPTSLLAGFLVWFFTGLFGQLLLLSTTRSQLSWGLLLVSSAFPLMCCCFFGVFCFVFMCLLCPSVRDCGVFWFCFPHVCLGEG